MRYSKYIIVILWLDQVLLVLIGQMLTAIHFSNICLTFVRAVILWPGKRLIYAKLI